MIGRWKFTDGVHPPCDATHLRGWLACLFGLICYNCYFMATKDAFNDPSLPMTRSVNMIPRSVFLLEEMSSIQVWSHMHCALGSFQIQ